MQKITTTNYDVYVGLRKSSNIMWSLTTILTFVESFLLVDRLICIIRHKTYRGYGI